ncbi:MAG: S-adenosyl-L-methionine-binding protein [Chloroflexi bacterium]|nr:S-adenosyl-L-methionine-binding protein [Chloroflexota bacterium]
MSFQEIKIVPIGYVENQFDSPTSGSTIRETESQLVIKPEFVEGLDGIEAGQEIVVLFYFHLAAPKGYNLRQHSRGDRSRPERGVFALRSPYRPNHIGVTRVEVLSIEGNTLTVTGLDAINQTPVLDIKKVW